MSNLIYLKWTQIQWTRIPSLQDWSLGFEKACKTLPKSFGFRKVCKTLLKSSWVVSTLLRALTFDGRSHEEMLHYILTLVENVIKFEIWWKCINWLKNKILKAKRMKRLEIEKKIAICTKCYFAPLIDVKLALELLVMLICCCYASFLCGAWLQW